MIIFGFISGLFLGLNQGYFLGLNLDYFWVWTRIIFGFRFGLFLGKIVSPIVMGIIFFLVVTPIGLLMRIIKKDLLNLRFNKNKSYWIEKGGPKSKMKNQF